MSTGQDDRRQLLKVTVLTWFDRRWLI